MILGVHLMRIIFPCSRAQFIRRIDIQQTLRRIVVVDNVQRWLAPDLRILQALSCDHQPLWYLFPEPRGIDISLQSIMFPPTDLMDRSSVCLPAPDNKASCLLKFITVGEVALNSVILILRERRKHYSACKLL